MNGEFLRVDPVTAARRLLGATIIARGVRALIIEVEAYGGPPDGPWPDPAAHSYRGRSIANAVMFGPPGRLYTYRSYGIHTCANISCGPDGTAGAVLLRAVLIVSGSAYARDRRGRGVVDNALARGPGNLCSALAITMDDNGLDLFDARSKVVVQRRETERTNTRIRAKQPRPQHAWSAGPRVGVSRAADRCWRFWIPDCPQVSAYRRSPRAPRPGDSD